MMSHYNDATPAITVDPETYEVTADGELLTSDGAAVLFVLNPGYDREMSNQVRASAVHPAGQWDMAKAIDCVVLGADERHRRRIVLTGEGGTEFLLDLPQATALRDGDGLVLEDGSIVLVAGKPEPVLDIEAASGPELARLAWHLGNRHTEVQIIGEKLRIRRDHVLEKMLKHLGARFTALDAPFDPESGAYGQAIGRLASHGLGRAPARDHTHDHGHHHGEEP